MIKFAEYINIARRPFLWLAVFVVIGIYLADGFSPFWVVIVLTAECLAFLTYFMVRYLTFRNIENERVGVRKNFYHHIFPELIIFLSITAFGTGVLRSEQNSAYLDSFEVERDSTANVSLELTSVASATLVGSDDDFWKATGVIHAINGQALSRGMPVYIYGKGGEGLVRGSLYTGGIYFYQERDALYPGAFNYQDFLHERGLVARVKITEGEWARPSAFSVLRLFDQLRVFFINNTLRYLPDQSGAFLAAAMFGYKGNIDYETKKNFQSVGISHILAISGLHVGLICALIWAFARLIFYDRRKVALICIIFSLLYLTVCGGHVAAARAGIIIVIYLSGYVIRRRSDFLNSLGAAAVVILLYNPESLYSIGFQLSFLAVVFLSCLHRELSSIETVVKYKSDTKLKKYFGYFISLLVMSSSAWLGVLPITMYSFNLIAFSGLLVNLLVVPLMSFSLIGGALLQLAALLPSSLVPAYAWLCSLPTKFILLIAGHSLILPGSGIHTYSPDKSIIIFYYLSFFALFIVGIYRKDIFKRQIKFLISLLLIVSFCLLMHSGFSSAQKPTPQSVVLPGKFGESLVVITPDNKVSVAGYIQRDGQDLVRFLSYLRVGRIHKLAVFNTKDKDEVCRNISSVFLVDEKILRFTEGTEIALDVSGNYKIDINYMRDRVRAWSYSSPETNAFFGNWLWKRQFDKYYNNQEYVFIRMSGKKEDVLEADHVYGMGAVKTENKLSAFSKVFLNKKVAPAK